MWHARRLRCIMVFMGKPEGSRPLWHVRKWENDFNMNLQESL
jgi:hypothetical protein